MRVAVVALGKIGLPLAVQFARSGHTVTGVDIDAGVVEKVNAGTAPFPGEANLADWLHEAVETGSLQATTDYADAIPAADVVVVVVPLVVDDETWEPDFAWMDSATQSIAAHLTADTLVCYETTLPVGTTRQRWLPMLESGSKLTEGADFHLVFSPERVYSGRIFADLRRYPKLIGAMSAKGAAAAVDFYEAALQFDARDDLARDNGVWDLGSPEAAELAKLAETTYRDVNIGLANQFARFAAGVGVDVFQVIEAANSQPFSHIHLPGIAVGGHCIPVYPRLYLYNDPSASIVRAAREANLEMPAYAVEMLSETIDDLEGATIAVLGASYRGGVKETAFSGVFSLVAELERLGARPVVHDPLFTGDELARIGLRPYHLGEAVDGAIVQADHQEYRRLSARDLPGLKVLVDGRRVTRAAGFAGVVRRVIGEP